MCSSSLFTAHAAENDNMWVLIIALYSAACDSSYFLNHVFFAFLISQLGDTAHFYCTILCSILFCLVGGIVIFIKLN